MLPGSVNRNENISTSPSSLIGHHHHHIGIVDGVVVANPSEDFVERYLGNSSVSSSDSLSNRLPPNPKTSDNLNNNQRNNSNSSVVNSRAGNIKLLSNNQNSGNDILNDFDLVAGLSNYISPPLKSPLSPTTFKASAFLANSNNPTETFNVNPILYVMTDCATANATKYPNVNLNNSNSNLTKGSTTTTITAAVTSGAGGPTVTATTTTAAVPTTIGTPSSTTSTAVGVPTTTTAMKTLISASPNHHHLRQNNSNGSINNSNITTSAPNTPETKRRQQLLLRNRTDNMMASVPPPTFGAAKKEKMEFNQMMMRMNYVEREGRPLSYHGKSTESSSVTSSPGYPTNASPVNRRHVSSSIGGRSRKETALLNRRSMPSPYLENRIRDKFDISDLDTNLPRIDLEAIENHLRIAREEERKRRTDREEIRRRLALESDDMNDKPGRKLSLHSRLQSSMNLQICFMNETASDSESPGSDNEIKQPPASLPCQTLVNKTQSGNNVNVMEGNGVSCGNNLSTSSEDFFTMQARLQAEARRALSQAKDLARLQMTQEKERRLQSPITEMVRNSLQKVGVALPNERRRVSRQLLTELNVAQLQVIVNDLHSHIEVLNETLVSMLLERDDLHMEQDSMLVDIEDLTRYLAAKDNSPHQSLPLIQPSKTLLGKKQHST